MTKKVTSQYKDQILDTLTNLAMEVVDERLRQIERWGEQNHPSYFGENDLRNAKRGSDYWHKINDARVEQDILTWDGILLEEVWEALAESDIERRREELIQVAAVALAEVEAIDRGKQRDLAKEHDEAVKAGLGKEGN